ncbi:Hypothetical protein NGAL_HAMBI1145_60520 [Neorhizobium galegae bv. officinalis]|uniref:ABC transporter domain-containing protein n=2 Tax=Neorhizobium galegae TaxID=399 RepID=A0A0T7H669_NEOGA|nr:Hypothetical protein NGAL_HAMBI1145_60520 [Neorhizobium galegae bv. officinalis]CDZ55050.1 Hypothetical protein NGAL_HAMBI1189_58060 [Neorhizobium galegae bv. officinalis]
MRNIPSRDAESRAAQALDMVQLGHLAHRKPKELSGGKQQRVALARALVIEPSILLLDDEMRVQICALQQESGIIGVFVTHDQVEALSMCDRVVVRRRARWGQNHSSCSSASPCRCSRRYRRGGSALLPRLLRRGGDHAIPHGPRISTLPAELYNYVYNQADPLVAAASTLLILLTLGVIMIVECAMGLGKAFVK